MRPHGYGATIEIPANKNSMLDRRIVPRLSLRRQRLKWFFALNAQAYDYDRYSELLKVAVHSAGKNTSLLPHFLFDGEENALTDWLRNRGVKILPCRTFLYDRLEELARKRRNPGLLAVGAGAFLRTEIPALTHDLGIKDKYVLYTDVDVMFLREVVTNTLLTSRPRYFAVAPQRRKHDYRHMNTGVMLLNLESLRSEDVRFRDFVSENLEEFVDNTWDQAAFRLYYGKSGPLGRGRRNWDKLPSQYNWKPYWGDYSTAKIVHFHGPKPHQRRLLSSGTPPESLKPLLGLTGEKYLELCELWEEMLRETDA
jgi:hypothetical protein